MRYAGLWRRLLAAVIDCASLWAAEVALVYAAWSMGLLSLSERELGEGLGLVLALLFWVVPAGPYFTLFECSTAQATPGKRLLCLRVTDLAGRRIRFGRANARHWSKLLSLPLFIGLMMVAFTARRQALHDMMAGTLVVRTDG